MTCDLCHRRSKRLLCPTCAEMIQRIHTAHQRMTKTEVCIAQKMAIRAAEQVTAQAQTENK